jgi:hypothetical protein
LENKVNALPQRSWLNWGTLAVSVSHAKDNSAKERGRQQWQLAARLQVRAARGRKATHLTWRGLIQCLT